MGFFNSCALVGHLRVSVLGIFVSGTFNSGCLFSNLGGSTGGPENVNPSGA